jgi:hypothetical protein
MPNWVFNNVDIYGTKEGLDDFRERALAYKSVFTDCDPDDPEPFENVFSFHAFITLPESKFAEYRETNGSKSDGNGGIIRTGDTEFNWYNWNSKNWHTKWDACNVEIDVNSDSNIQIRFDTAWSPPMPVFEKMVSMFPALSFVIEWEEEQEWGGRARGECGEFAVIEEWDIPNCHEDYVYRGKECGNCERWYADTPDEWYDDCPDKAEQIAKQNMEKNMVNNTITVVGADTSVGEVVESFIDNHLINDETIYEVGKIDVYGIGKDWNRLTGADIEIETEGGITNRYIDPIREQFPAVDIEVVGVND